jgi:hypothetical protein
LVLWALSLSESCCVSILSRSAKCAGVEGHELSADNMILALNEEQIGDVWSNHVVSLDSYLNAICWVDNSADEAEIDFMHWKRGVC